MAETQTTPLPPTFVKASRVGCLAQEITQSDGTMRWIVRVYVDYIDGQRWTKLYAMRDANNRKKALRDCDDWLKLANRKIKVPTVLHADDDDSGSSFQRSTQ